MDILYKLGTIMNNISPLLNEKIINTNPNIINNCELEILDDISTRNNSINIISVYNGKYNDIACVIKTYESYDDFETEYMNIKEIYNETYMIKTIGISYIESISYNQQVYIEKYMLIMEKAKYDLSTWYDHNIKNAIDNIVEEHDIRKRNYLTIDLGIRISKCISYLHEKDHAHLDIKMSNILICQDSNIRLCDFEYCTNEKKSDKFRGSPYYIAPEIVRLKYKNNGTYKFYDTHKADIYSLGVNLYFIFHGHFPYVMKDVKIKDLFDAKFNVLQNCSSKMDPIMSDTIHSMLCMEPDNRRTISQVIDDLYILKYRYDSYNDNYDIIY